MGAGDDHSQRQPSRDESGPSGGHSARPKGAGSRSSRAEDLVAALATSAQADPAKAREPEDPHLAAFAASDTGEDASRVLRDAVRRAPLPSLSGLCYEVMGLAWFFGAAAGLMLLSMAFDDLSLVRKAVGPLFEIPSPTQHLEIFLIGVPVAVICIRVAAGLGAIASDGVGQGSGANAWRAWGLGRRDTIASVGIACQIFGMMASATLVLLGPLVVLSTVIGRETLGLFGVVLSGLALAFMLVYGAALGALQELSMASLVRHHRGVGSAILHGWRLMRARPLSSQRMAAAEFASRVVVVGLAVTVGRTVERAVSGPAGWTWGLVTLVILGALVGGLRCHAWSLAYPRIGGLARVREEAAAE